MAKMAWLTRKSPSQRASTTSPPLVTLSLTFRILCISFLPRSHKEIKKSIISNTWQLPRCMDWQAPAIHVVFVSIKNRDPKHDRLGPKLWPISAHDRTIIPWYCSRNRARPHQTMVGFEIRPRQSRPYYGEPYHGSAVIKKKGPSFDEPWRCLLYPLRHCPNREYQYHSCAVHFHVIVPFVSW